MKNTKQGVFLKLLKSIISFYFYGSIHIALGAGAMTIMSFYLWGKNPKDHIVYILAIFLSTIAFYSLHRIIDLNYLRQINQNNKYDSIYNLRKVLRVTIVLSALGAFAFLLILPLKIQFLLIAVALLTLWYSVPPMKGIKKLKEFANIKIFIIAFVWGLITAGIPAYLSGGQTASYILAFWERSIFIFAITLPFDVRDYILDQRLAIRTLPYLMGKTKTIQVAVFLILFIESCFLFMFYSLDYWSLRSIILLLLTNILIAALVWYSKRTTKDLFFTAILDGTLILQPLVYFMLK